MKKRVDVVSIKMCKDRSILYEPRYIRSPVDGVKLAEMFIADCDREEFIVISLDSKCQPTSINIASRGTTNSALVTPRKVFKPAILSNASLILVAHNHPSGIPDPSKEDISLTERLKEAADIIGIKLMDHLIIGDEDRYYSFKENQLL